MPQPLIPVGELISSGWDRFLADGKRNLELSVRFILSSVVVFAAALLSQNMPAAGQLALNLLALAVAAVINVHTMVTLTDFILRRDIDPSKPVEPSVEIGRKLFWPFVLVALLQGLAVLGGLAALVIPGLWLSVLLGYSILVLLEDNRRGLQALAGSAEIVRGRWWSVLGRNIVAGIVVGLLIAITTLLLLIFVGLFIGMDKIFAFANYANDLQASNPLADGIETLINGIVRSLFIPLAIIYQVKIYHSLKKTRM
ncbi:MAG TPA: hypothetical protein VMU11_01290 [Verrucomicrobiae bacterium]|nr:hypothetical protein [Verrucomicrobiae bacterium]